MNDILIPFALNKVSGTLVEVGDVERGRMCGCLCPSCKQGVMSRHGDVNAWHFAHDQNSKDKPVKECEISFDSCCRQYTIELMLGGLITKVHTPSLVVSDTNCSYLGVENTAMVTESRLLENLSFENSANYDLSSRMSSFELLFHLEYDGRKLPSLPSGHNSGLLAIDIGVIKRQFYTQKTTRGLLKRLIISLIEEDINNKRWMYHPSEGKVRENLRKTIENQSRVRDIPITPRSMEEKSRPAMFKERYKRTGNYTCIMCNSEWDGLEFTDALCQKCSTHLYSRFVAN